MKKLELPPLVHNHAPTSYEGLNDNPSQIKPKGLCPKCDELHDQVEREFEWCKQCNGLKGIQGKMYGWAGKWCSCWQNK